MDMPSSLDWKFGEAGSCQLSFPVCATVASTASQRSDRWINEDASARLLPVSARDAQSSSPVTGRRCYGNQDTGSTWAWEGPHETPWRRAHRIPQISRHGTGFDGSWPVGGKVGSADQVSAPNLVITEQHAAQRPLAWAFVHFCLGTLSSYQLTCLAKTGVWKVNQLLSGWWELVQKFPSSLTPVGTRLGCVFPTGPQGPLQEAKHPECCSALSLRRSLRLLWANHRNAAAGVK